MAGPLAIMAAMWFVFLIVAVIMIVAMWKIFVKAGKPGWAALVPVYSLVILMEIVGRPVWWVALYFLAVIPFVGFIATISCANNCYLRFS